MSTNINKGEAFHYVMKYERNIGGEEFVAEAISRSVAKELNKKALAAREIVTKFSELGLLHLMRFGKRR